MLLWPRSTRLQHGEVNWSKVRILAARAKLVVSYWRRLSRQTTVGAAVRVPYSFTVRFPPCSL
jgi:hypothetical protein